MGFDSVAMGLSQCGYTAKPMLGVSKMCKGRVVSDAMRCKAPTARGVSRV